MNYFAHGRDLVDRPYELAGVALPDWLAASDRGARLRRRRVDGAGDPRTEALAKGVLKHLDDDDWFHRTHAFLSVSGELTARVRALGPEDRTLRAGFWGHVLTEILLDAHLIEGDPARLDAYYAALDGVDAAWIHATAAAWTTRPPVRLATFIDRFRRWRFLCAYPDDAELKVRLDGLAGRVGLPPLPPSFMEQLPAARQLVAEHAGELLEKP